MGIGVDAATDLNRKITDYTLARVARQLEHPEVVTGPHHHRATARQPIVLHCRMIDVEAPNLPVIEEHVLVVRLRLLVRAIAVVVELLLSANEPHDVAVPRPRRLPRAADVAAHPLVVSATQERGVVHLESGAAPVLTQLPQPEPIV